MQQLKKREDDLRQKAEEVGKYMEVIQSYNDLLTELTRMRDEWIMVVKADDKSILYCNKRSGKFHTEEGSCDFCQHRLEFQHHLLDWEPSECERVWEAEDGCGQCFLILSFSIPWKDGLVYAHVVANVTEEKQRTRQLTDKAYSDPGTGIFNRRYAEEQLEHMLKRESLIHSATWIWTGLNMSMTNSVTWRAMPISATLFPLSRPEYAIPISLPGLAGMSL